MHESSRVKVSGPHIVSEVIDGEAIIIDLNTGNYYSLQDAGAEIWAGVEDELTIEGIVDRLRARYEGDSETIRRAALALVDQLESEGLIATDGDSPQRADPRHDAVSDSLERVPSSPPDLRTYTDMQELLLLDPIHEVDATGWPTLSPDTADSGQ
jgi:hypothetical protein